MVVVFVELGFCQIEVACSVFTLPGIAGLRFIVGLGHTEELANKREMGLAIKGNGVRN